MVLHHRKNCALIMKIVKHTLFINVPYDEEHLWNCAISLGPATLSIKHVYIEGYFLVWNKYVVNFLTTAVCGKPNMARKDKKIMELIT